MKKTICHVLVFAMLLSLFASVLPSLDLHAAGSYTFDFTKGDSPVVVIDAQLIAENGGATNFNIPSGAFSVTVIGNIDVTLIFTEDITIDRTADTANSLTTLASELQTAGKRLAESDDSWAYSETDGEYYIPTCPFRVTGGARVRVSFSGESVFRAGYNGWISDGLSVTNVHGNNGTTGYKGGYAAVQVDGDSSLTIDAAPNGLEAYGAYPLAGQPLPTNSSQNYPDNPLYVNPYFNAYYDEANNRRQELSGTSGRYDTPDGIVLANNNEANGGGAGIGGGVSHNTKTIQKTYGYADGTPGEIIINGGVITAAGGHQAAGIGGGINSSSTTSKIEINGGTVIAVGGRWACGIGDGDSLNSYTSDAYLAEKQIVINGGTVNAYGGTASAAIGTTDNIQNRNASHGLTIALAGGKITALSGEADTTKGDECATAAIGAGQNTNMNDNSISVSAKATVSAASFSQYAISDCGTNAGEIPSVNIDPDGYMYLARFANAYVADEANREFVCYHVKADEKGNPMLLAIKTTEIEDFDETTYDDCYYALNRTNKRYYLVNANGSVMTEAQARQEGLTDYTVDLTDGLLYPNEIPDLTYYYLTNKIVEKYSVPAKYKAIAMTLPDPTMVSVSGTYILRVPDNAATATTEDDTFVVIQKPTAGTSSGTIDASHDTHVSAGANDGSVNLTPNITEDAVAKELISLAVDYDSEELIQKYHGRFYPTTYAYTVYLPRMSGSAIDFDLSFAYETTDVDTIDIIEGTHTKEVFSGSELIGSHAISFTLEENAEKMEIWIKKSDEMDPLTRRIPTVTYKITVIRKPLYVLEMKPLSKVYDGEPVEAVVEHMYIPGEGLSDNIGLTDLKDKDPVDGERRNSYSVNNGPFADMAALTKYALPTFGSNGQQTFSYSFRQGWNRYDGEVDLTVTHSVKALNEPGQFHVITDILYVSNRVTQTLTTTIQVDLVQGTVTTPGVDSDGAYSESIADFEIVKNSTDTSASIILQSDDSAHRYKYTLITVDIGAATINSTMTEQEVADAKNAAVQNAIDKMTQNLENNHWTMASETVEYTKGVYDATFLLNIETATSVKSNNSGTNLDPSKVSYQIDNQTVTGRVLVTATYDHDVDMTYLLTAEDMENIDYEYHIAATGGVGSGEVLRDAPSDAGTYHVRATLEADTFEAEGIDEFVIERRVIHITGVKNWRTYLSETQIAEIAQNRMPVLEVAGYESFVFDNLVDGHEGQIEVIMKPNVKLDASLQSAVNYYEGGAQLQISYTPTKILILPVRLNESDSVTKNYRFPDAQISKRYENDDGYTWYWFSVPGELSYVVDDAMFKKEEGDSPWQKFWPDAKGEPLQWAVDENGNFVVNEDGSMEPHPDEKRIDYHSPSNSQHREYIYIHTVNQGEKQARYAVDIEYGALQYTYSKTIWNVNTHEYVSVDAESYWSGNEGFNNKITIINRSNRDIYYSAEAVLDAYFGAGCEVFLSEEATMPEEDERSATITSVTVFRTAENADEAESESFYVYLDGTPQMSSPNDGLRSTGKVTITITSTKPNAQNE